MRDVDQLIRRLHELDDLLVACMKCGMCQAVCPVYTETGSESMVARGKTAMLEGLALRMIKDPEGVKERLDACLLCGACAANCPSGVKTLDIFLKARSILTGYLGLSPAKKAIFRGMLSRPKLFNAVMSMASRFQGIFTRQVNEMLGSSCARFQAPLVGDRHFPRLAGKPMHDRYTSLDESPEAGKPRVAFYFGCVVDKIYPHIGETILDVFSHHGIGVFMPVNQACCGIPALSSGDGKTFDKLVRTNVELFNAQDFDYLVTPCATCTSTIKKIWPSMSADYHPDIKNAVEAIASRTMDVSEFIVKEIGVAPVESSSDAVRVTYHDPCHLKKSLGVADQPRKLIQSNPAYHFVEMIDADACCGCGGTFTLQFYEISLKIGEKKRRRIVEADPAIVATSCPACMMQITNLLSRHGDRFAIKHPVEIYAETLGIK